MPAGWNVATTDAPAVIRSIAKPSPKPITKHVILPPPALDYAAIAKPKVRCSADLAFSVTHRMQSDEIDIIAIGPPGVRVIEVKHWSGEWIANHRLDVDHEAELVKKGEKGGHDAPTGISRPGARERQSSDPA